MIATTIPIRNFVEGRNYPSPVSEMIGLGYYDGVTNGILRTADGAVYSFDMIGEMQGSDDGEDIRRFELKSLPTDTFDRIVAALERYHTPTWPQWIPIWKFPDVESQAKVDSLIDEQIGRATEPKWVIEASNLLQEIVTAHCKHVV